MISKVQTKKVAGPVDYTLMQFVLKGFTERSGDVIARVGNDDLLRLDLGTKVVKRLHNQEGSLVSFLFFHEVDPVSLLQGMKYS